MSVVRSGALLCACLATAAALAQPAMPAVAATAPPLPAERPAASVTGLSGLLTRLQSLYLKAEQATEAYDGTKEKLTTQQARYTKLDGQLTDRRAELRAARDAAGALAREQYRSGGISPYMRLLLSDDPTEALSQAHILRQAAVHQAGVTRRLQSGERALTTTTAKARTSLETVRRLAGQRRRESDRVQADLDDVERTVATLTGGQLTALTRLEAQDTQRAQEALLASGKLGGGALPSASGERAIGYAIAQLGKPYVWGAQGPRSFDCSGLTSQAWDHAGRVIPRTSQEQWSRLPKVTLGRIRPGDLIVYYPGATHVALYVGDGLIIQAPRPGAVVRVSPVAAGPILGAVRPDTGAASLKDPKAPRLPKADATTPLGGRDH